MIRERIKRVVTGVAYCKVTRDDQEYSRPNAYAYEPRMSLKRSCQDDAL